MSKTLKSLQATNAAVALMILRNDREGAVQWAKGLLLEDTGGVDVVGLPAYGNQVRYDGLGFGLSKALEASSPTRMPAAQEVAVALAMEFARNHPDFTKLYGTFMTEQLDAFYNVTCNGGKERNHGA